MNSDEAQVREQLKHIYVESCDRQRVNPSLHVLGWLANGALEQPSFVDTPSLMRDMRPLDPSTATEDVSDGYLQPSSNSDPIEPLLDVMKWISLTHVTFDGTNLDASQLGKLMHMLLGKGADADPSSSRRSQWSLSALYLYGNQMDPVVFDLLLEVVEQYPMLTLVRLDPHPQCHMYELEQRCAANDARRRQPFAVRKRGEVDLALSLRKTSQSAPPLRTADGMSVSVAVTQSWTAAHEFEVPVSSFFGAIRAWVFFFFGADKRLPDAMFYFLMQSLYTGLQVSQSYMELMEVLKSTEKKFMQWREGSSLSGRDEALPVPEPLITVLTPDPNRCANCDARVEETELSQQLISVAAPPTNAVNRQIAGVSFSLASSVNPVAQQVSKAVVASARHVVLDLGRTVIDALAMESETGGKCLVQNTSSYLSAVLFGVLRRCVEVDTQSMANSDVNIARGKTVFNFRKPPVLCPSRLQHCAKHFARSVLAAASGLDHGARGLATLTLARPTSSASPMESNLLKARGSIADDTVSAASGASLPTLLPIQAFQGISETQNDRIDLVAIFEREVAKRSVFSKTQREPSSPAVPNVVPPLQLGDCRQPPIEWSAASSAIQTLVTVANRHVAGHTVCIPSLLSATWPGCAWARYPTEGARLESVIRGVSREGIPMVPLQPSCGGVLATMRPTCVVHFLPRNNSVAEEQQALPFSRLLLYFLLHRDRLHGSDVIAGIKLRPAVIEQITNKSHQPFIIASEPTGAGATAHGITASVAVIGVTRLNGVWYAVSLYGREQQVLLVDEVCFNRGALKYGAFALLDCPLRDWLDAVRAVCPIALSPSLGAVSFPLELLERASEVETALTLMLHDPLFYATPQAFASRLSTMFQASQHHAIIAEIQKVIAFHAPSAVRVSAANIWWLIERYRCGDMGSLANYWSRTLEETDGGNPSDHPPSWFLRTVLAATRMVNGRNPFSVQHVSLFPMTQVAGTPVESNSDGNDLESTEPVLHIIDLIPPTVSLGGSPVAALWTFSGQMIDLSLLSSSPTRTDPRSWLPVSMGVDLEYYRPSAAQSAAARFDQTIPYRRYMSVEFPNGMRWRVCRAEIQFFEPRAIDKLQSPASRQIGYVVRLALSDDGVSFTYCRDAVYVESPSVRAQSKRTVVSYPMGNVGPHAHWVIFVDAINDKGVVIQSRDEAFNRHLVFPTVESVRFKYLSDVVSPRHAIYCDADSCGTVEYREDVWIVVPNGDTTQARLMEAPASQVGCPEPIPKSKCATWLSEKTVSISQPVNLVSRGNRGSCGYLTAALRALGGDDEAPWDATIALGNSLFVFRLPLLIEVDRHSGQLRTHSANSVDSHPIWSLIPASIASHLLGGFELRFGASTSGDQLVLVYHQTHFAVISATHLEVIIPATSWDCLPGRLVAELDENGVASRKATAPSQLPFVETTLVMPLHRAVVSQTSQRLLINFSNSFVIWDFDLSVSSASAKSKLLAALPAVDKVPPLPLSAFAPLLCRTASIAQLMDRALNRSTPKSIRRSLTALNPVVCSVCSVNGRNGTHSHPSLVLRSNEGRALRDRSPVNSTEDACTSVESVKLQFDEPCVPTVVQVAIESRGCSLGLFRLASGSLSPEDNQSSSQPIAVGTHDHSGIVTLLTLAAGFEASTMWEIRPVSSKRSRGCPGKYLAIRTLISPVVVSRAVTGFPTNELRLGLDSTYALACGRVVLEHGIPKALNVASDAQTTIALGVSFAWINCCSGPVGDEIEASITFAVQVVRDGTAEELGRREIDRVTLGCTPEIALIFANPVVMRPNGAQLQICYSVQSHTLPDARHLISSIEADATVHCVPLQSVSLLDSPLRGNSVEALALPGSDTTHQNRPLHLRTSASTFARDTVTRDAHSKLVYLAGRQVGVSSQTVADLVVARESSPCDDGHSDIFHVENAAGAAGYAVWREGPQRDVVIAIESLSHRRRLCFISAELDLTSTSSPLIQPVSVSYQALSGDWIHFMDTFVDASGRVDAYWKPCTILADPPPALWRLSFVHDVNGIVSLRGIVLQFHEGIRVASARGYSCVAMSTSINLLPLSVASELLIPRGKILKFTGHQLLAAANSHGGNEDDGTVITLDVPPSVSLISGVKIHFVSPLLSTASHRVAVHGLLHRDLATRVVLWQQPSTYVLEDGALIASWPPCHLSELHIVHANGDVGAIELLSAAAFDALPMRLESQRMAAAADGIRITLSSGMTTVDVLSLPASLPFNVGSRIVVSPEVTKDTATDPLFYSSLSLRASQSGVLFGIAMLEEGDDAFQTIAQIRTAAHQTVQVSWDIGSMRYPRAWRLNCLETGSVSEVVGAVQGFYMDVDFAFEWLSVCPNVTAANVQSACAAFLTNALIRRPAASGLGALQQPSNVQKQRALSLLHGGSPNPPLVHVSTRGSNDLVDVGNGATWEKRSQTSVASSAFAGQSTAPFVFLTCDLHSDSRAFIGLSALADVDAETSSLAEFEMTVECCDDGATFEPVAVHRQRDGWCATTWSDVGHHRYWRLVIAYSNVASSDNGSNNTNNRKGRRSQSVSFGADVDDKLLTPFVVDAVDAALRNVVWIEASRENSLPPLPLPTDDTVAIRAASLSRKTGVPSLNPTLFSASPIGLRIPQQRQLICGPTDPVADVGMYAFWRSCRSRPVQLLQRAAAAAEDQLQHSLPNLTNPHHVLEKAASAEITATFFEGAPFELNDASLTTGCSRLQNYPTLTVRGSTLTGVRGVPPGTKVALTFEWSNYSLVPAHPAVEVRTILTMARTWLSLQSEWASFDQLCRTIPSLRTEIWCDDLEPVVAIYALVGRDKTWRFGGNFDPLPLPLPTTENSKSPSTSIGAGVELEARTGVTVVTKPTSTEALIRVCESAPGLSCVLPVLYLMFGASSFAAVSLHTDFQPRSPVTIEIVPLASPVSPDDHSEIRTSTGPAVTWKSLKVSITFDPSLAPSVAISPNISIQELIGANVAKRVIGASLSGCVSLPQIFGSDATFFAHAVLRDNNTRRNTLRVSVHACDDRSAQSHLIGQDTSFDLKGIGGVVGYSVRTDRKSNEFRLHREYCQFHALVWLSNTWQIPCQFAPVAGSGYRHPTVEFVTNTSCRFTNEQLMSFVKHLLRSNRHTLEETAHKNTVSRLAFGSQAATPASQTLTEPTDSSQAMPSATPLADCGADACLDSLNNFVGQFRLQVRIEHDSEKLSPFLEFEGHASVAGVHLLPLRMKFPLSATDSQKNVVRATVYVRGNVGMQYRWGRRGMPLHVVTPATAVHCDNRVSVSGGHLQVHVARDGTGSVKAAFRDVCAASSYKTEGTNVIGVFSSWSSHMLMPDGDEKPSCARVMIGYHLPRLIALETALQDNYFEWLDLQLLRSMVENELRRLFPQFMIAISSVRPSWGANPMWNVSGAVAGVPFRLHVLVGAKQQPIVTEIAEAIIQCCASKVISVQLWW